MNRFWASLLFFVFLYMYICHECPLDIVGEGCRSPCRLFFKTMQGTVLEIPHACLILPGMGHASSGKTREHEEVQDASFGEISVTKDIIAITRKVSNL